MMEMNFYVVTKPKMITLKCGKFESEQMEVIYV